MKTELQTVTRDYRKDDSTIGFKFLLCPSCHGDVRFIASAGCNHDDNYTHFGQCFDCKNVYEMGYRPTYTHQELEEAGWKKA